LAFILLAPRASVSLSEAKGGFMHSRSTRKVFLATALLCCCVAALAMAGMVAANVHASGWVDPQKVLENVPVSEEPEEAKSLALGKGDPLVEADIAPMALDSAAQGLRPEVEPNGTAATATALGADTVAVGNVFPAADVDDWSFVGAAGDRVYAAVQTSGAAGSSGDSELRLLGTDGATVLEFDQDDGSLAATSSTIAGATTFIDDALGTSAIAVPNIITMTPIQSHETIGFRWALMMG